MNKRILARIPFRLASDGDVALAMRTEGRAKFFHVREIADMDLLAVSIYLDHDLRSDARAPYACVYLGRDGYITRKYTESGRLAWLAGRLESVAPIHWNEAEIILDEESTQALRTYYGVERASLQNIDDHQQRILSARLAVRHQAIKDRIDRHMALIPKLPEDFHNFIHKALKNRYMFYTYKDRRSVIGYCTECRKEVMIPRPRHNQAVQCPDCGTTATAKARKKFKHPLYDTGRVCLPQQTAEGFALRYFAVQRREYTDGRVKFQAQEDARVLFGDEATTYEYGRFKNTQEVRWRDPIHNEGYYLDGNGVYPMDMKLLTANTKWQYACTDDLQAFMARKCRSSLHHYFLTYQKHPYIEYFVKVGLRSLADMLMNLGNSRPLSLNHDKRRLHEILGVRRTSLPILIELDAAPADVELVRALESTGTPFDCALIREIRSRVGRNSLRFVEWVLPRYSVRKGLRYASTADSQIWLDYIRMAAEIGYDLRDEKVMFPRNLEESHDSVVAIHRLQKDENAQREFNKLTEQMKVYRWQPEQGDYLITTPESADTLYTEGKVLDHCVHSYINRIVSGESVIAFLRNKSEPDVPFVTIEIRNRRIAQARGFDNHDPDRASRAFVKQYGDHLLQCPDWRVQKAA